MTKFKKSLFSFLLIFIFIACCEGQSASTQSQKDQISTSSKEKHPTMIRTQGSKFGVVSGELLDKSGNLWFSVSGEGAYLFDGISFTNYTAKDGLCSNHVSAIIQDRLGNILLGTNCGIAVYDGKTFKKFPIPDTLNITCMLEDKEGNLWFGTKGNGIYCYNGATLQNFLNGQSFNLGSTNQLILDMIQDRNGNLWFSSWNGGGVWRYDGKTFTNFTESKGLVNNAVMSVMKDNNGNVWFGTKWFGLSRYDGKTFKTFSQPNH